ncbi:MAG: toll/interleukin-1 receptor domain-containing protein, partial [Polyangiaceae bacterium]
MTDHRMELLERLAKVALTQDEFIPGLELRVTSTFGKPEMRKLLTDLTPELIEVTGEYPDDHYRIKARGILKTSRCDLFLSGASDFREFVIDLYSTDPNFRSFSWHDVTGWLKRSNHHVEMSVEGARFVFMCIGVWGGGGSGDGWTWMRPVSEMLELIVDPTETDLSQLIQQAQAFLYRSRDPRVFQGETFASSCVTDVAIATDTPSWDFFIAHAGPDHVLAEELYEALSGRCRVFLDTRSVRLGDDWDTTLAKAQQRSEVTVVLVSSRAEQAYYVREEIAQAIALARLDPNTHRVVPIYADRLSDTRLVPYGLRLKHGIALGADCTVAGAAERLL